MTVYVSKGLHERGSPETQLACGQGRCVRRAFCWPAGWASGRIKGACVVVALDVDRMQLAHASIPPPVQGGEISCMTAHTPIPGMIDGIRRMLRTREYSPKTEKAYLSWITRFLRFHDSPDWRSLDQKHARGVPASPLFERGIGAEV